MTPNEISPMVGSDFYFRAKVLSVKYVKEQIVLRLEEYNTKCKFTLKFSQQMLPGVDDGDS